jgi:hypothetical protein
MHLMAQNAFKWGWIKGAAQHLKPTKDLRDRYFAIQGLHPS